MGEEHELKGLGSLGKKTPFYRWGKIQQLCSQPAQSGTTAPRSGTTTRPHGNTARDRGTTAKGSVTTTCERY